MAPRTLSASAADSIVTAALERGVGGSVNAAVTPGDKFFVSARMVLTRGELDAVASSRTLTAKFNKITYNVSRVGVALLKRLWTPWRTGASRSSWRVDRVGERGAPGSLATRLVITNPTPWTKFVHKAGTPRRKKLYREVVPEAVDRMKAELTRDLTAPDFTRALKASMLSTAFATPGVGRRR